MVAPPPTPPAARRLLVAAAVGVLGGVLSGFFGIGGGIIMVPLLIVLVGMDQREASATSLVAIVPTALAGTITYGLRGEVAVVPGLLVAAGGMAGSLLGARFLRTLPLKTLSNLFVALLVVVALTLFLDAPVRAEPVGVSPFGIIGYIVLGLFVGVASGLFGIGGGVIAVPAFMTLFGLEALVAKGTSLLMMLPTSITGSISHVRNGVVRPWLGLLIGAFAVLGSLVGVELAHTVPERWSDLLFAVLLLYSAWQLWRRAHRR